MAVKEFIQSAGSKIMEALTTPITTARDNTPPHIKYILEVTEAERWRQERVLMARRYHAGRQDVKLTDRLKEFLGNDYGQFAVRLNFTKKVSTAISDRMVIEGFENNAESDTEKTAQDVFCETVWNGSRMKGKRARTLTETVRDGEYFILIDYDRENGRARLTPHESFTDTQVSVVGCEARAMENGNGEGMRMFYPNDDVDQKPHFAVKRWWEQVPQLEGGFKREEWLNIYFENRIEKWRKDATGWMKRLEKRIEPVTKRAVDLPWPEPWTRDGTPNGEALGIPVVHVKSPDLLPAAMEAIPIQKGLNKLFVDLLATSDFAFPFLLTFGWYPTSDGTRDGVPLAVAPGTSMGTNEPDSSAEVVNPGDVNQQITAIDKLLNLMADVTGTPLSMLQTSTQRAAEGTLQETKEPFFAKVRNYCDTVGLAFEEAMKTARKVQNTFGGDGLNEEVEFTVKWGEIAVKSIAEKAAEAAAKLASGYTEEEVQRTVWNEDETTIKRMANDRNGLGDGFNPPADNQGAAGDQANADNQTAAGDSQVNANSTPNA